MNLKNSKPHVHLKKEGKRGKKKKRKEKKLWEKLSSSKEH